MAKKEGFDRILTIANTLKVYDPSVHGVKNPFEDVDTTSNEQQASQILYDEIKEAVEDDILNADANVQEDLMKEQKVLEDVSQPPEPENYNQKFKDEYGEGVQGSDPILEAAGLKAGESFSMVDIMNSITKPSSEGFEFVPFDKKKGVK